MENTLIFNLLPATRAFLLCLDSAPVHPQVKLMGQVESMVQIMLEMQLGVN